MILLRSWQESLALFLPHNFKLFMLTVMKSAIETYGYLFYYFWWLVVLLGVSYIGYMAPEFLIDEHVQWLQYIFAVTEKFIWFVLIVLVRASVREKGTVYFRQAVRKNLIGFFAYVFFWEYVRFYVGNFLLGAASYLGLSDHIVVYIPLLTIFFGMPLLLLPVFIFSALFFSDSDGSVRAWLVSLWQAIKMSVYNWPFCVVSLLVLVAIVIGLFSASYMMTGSHVLATIIFFIIQPVIVTYFKNFYIKRVHDRFNLFYPYA